MAYETAILVKLIGIDMNGMGSGGTHIGTKYDPDFASLKNSHFGFDQSPSKACAPGMSLIQRR